MRPTGHFDFERLDAYAVALEVARWARDLRWPAHTRHLHDQALRTADSIVLNLAEGASSSGGNRRRHYDLARGSAGEVFAITELLVLPGGDEVQGKLRRLNQMLARLR